MIATRAGVIGMGVVAMLALTLAAAPTPQWRLADSKPITKPSVHEHYVDGDHWVINTANPHLSGRLLVDDTRRYIFRLYRDNRLAWERPAPSDGVIIPDEAELVIFIGKEYGEGKVTDGKNVARRVTSFDVRGKQIAFVDTGPMSDAEAFADGRFLYTNNDSILMIDMTEGGRLLWQVPSVAHRLTVFAGERYFATYRSIVETREYVTTLFDARTGNALHSVRDTFDVFPRFFAVSTDQAFAFLSYKRPGNPYTWDVAVYGVENWAEPVAEVRGIRGNPFGADRRRDGKIAIGHVVPAASRSPNDLTPTLELRDSDGGLAFSHAFDPSSLDVRRAFVRFNATGEELRLLYDSTEFSYVDTTSDD